MTTPAPYVRLCTRMWLRSPKSEVPRRLQTGQVTPVPGGGWTPAWRRWRFCRWSWRASVHRASKVTTASWQVECLGWTTSSQRLEFRWRNRILFQNGMQVILVPLSLPATWVITGGQLSIEKLSWQRAIERLVIKHCISLCWHVCLSVCHALVFKYCWVSNKF